MPDEAPRDCLRCHVAMVRGRPTKLRTEGLAGLWGLLFFLHNLITVRLLQVDVYRCPSCRLIEFVASDESSAPTAPGPAPSGGGIGSPCFASDAR